LSQLGGADESQDVGVVLQVKNLLLGGSLVEGGRSDSHNVVNLQVWELESESKGEPGGSALVSQFQFVGVLVHLVDGDDLGNNIEVGLLGRSLAQLSSHIRGNDWIVTKVLGSPLSELGKEVSVVLFKSIFLSEVAESSVVVISSSWGLLVSGEEGPGAVVRNGGVELSLALVNSNDSSVNSNNVSDSVDDWEIFEFVGVDDNGGVVRGVSSSLGRFDVNGWVDNLQGADVSLLVNLVWEGGVNDYTIEVLWLSTGDGSLGEFSIFVMLSVFFLGRCSWSSGFFRGSLFAHVFDFLNLIK